MQTSIAKPQGARPARGSLLIDTLVTLLFAGLLAPLLRLDLVGTPELPTGGDMASHVLYAWLFDQIALPEGRLTAWLPEVFAGYPLHAYYFPLPFIAASLFGTLTGFAAGLKWSILLPALLLPGTVFTLSRRALQMSGLAAFCGALGALSFLVNEQNTFWGGNLLSTLAGEFAYSWGVWLALMTLVAWVHVVRTGRGWPLAAVLEASTAFAHGYPLLVTGFASWLLLINASNRRTTALLLLKGHSLAFLLLGGWLWPLLEMHGLTIPNDGSSSTYTWSAMLPQTLWPILAGGALSLPVVLIKGGKSEAALGPILFFLHAAALTIVFWISADRVGLLDIRFLPLAWLWAAIASGWTLGSTIDLLLPRHQPVAAMLLLISQAAWLIPQIHQAPHWALWNFSGTLGKAGWPPLTKLFPSMAGTLASPRLLFEHSPANQDLGSTRSLETLPMYLGGRPVLEGLYMESSIVGPAVYRLQSEVSAQPSSPLYRFPSGQLDPVLAASHMQMLRTNQVLLRSAEAKQALLASGLFAVVAESPPFLLLELKSFDDALVDGTHRSWRLKPLEGWMEDSHTWFGSARRMTTEWPVYADSVTPEEASAFSNTVASAHIDNPRLSRDRLSFSTSAPGQPHLAKMTYNPRWQLETKGKIYLAAPGFMVIVPAEREVRMVFGTTKIGWLGQVASAVAGIYLIVLLCRRRSPAAPISGQVLHAVRGPANTATAALLLASSLWFYETSASRLYTKGWVEMNAGHFNEAAKLLLNASRNRHAPPAREEALFWASRAFEQAGMQDQALAGYQDLVEHGHGYWVPESLYIYSRVMRERGQLSQALKVEARLKTEFPNSEWTRKLNSTP